MTEDQALDVAYQTIRAMLLVSAPLMIVGLVVGLVIAVFQALTQIQEATLTFVPKILAVFVAMLFTVPGMLAVMEGLMAYVLDLVVSLG